jgi:hypothetical protein
MARSLDAAFLPTRRGISHSDIDDILALIERAPFDPSYGDKLRQLLPRRLSELTTRH